MSHLHEPVSKAGSLILSLTFPARQCILGATQFSFHFQGHECSVFCPWLTLCYDTETSEGRYFVETTCLYMAHS